MCVCVCVSICIFMCVCVCWCICGDPNILVAFTSIPAILKSQQIKSRDAFEYVEGVQTSGIFIYGYTCFHALSTSMPPPLQTLPVLRSNRLELVRD